MAETQAVQRKADLLPAPIISLVQALVPDCKVLLPSDITTEQFRAALWLELTGRPQLHTCYAESLRECVVKAATYGMLPGRDCHFLPFGEKGRKERKATFVSNYFGVLRALYRTGMVTRAFAEVVYTNDVFDLDYGRTPPLMHRPPRKNRGTGEGAYGYILQRGSAHPLIHYMDPDDLDRVRKRAPAHEQGPWVTDQNEMKRKTAMKNTAKYAQLTPLLKELFDEDDARQLEDIPAARHQQNIVDLFGDKPGPPSQYAQHPMVDPGTEAPRPDPWCDGCNTAGHYPEECPQKTHSADRAPRPQPQTAPSMPKRGLQNSGTPGNPQQALPDEPSWKQTLRAHRETIGQKAVSGIYNPEARDRLEGLLEKIDFVLSPLGTVTDAEGFALADATLQWIDAMQEGR